MTYRSARLLACLTAFTALLFPTPRLLAECNCPIPEVIITAIPSQSSEVVQMFLGDPADENMENDKLITSTAQPLVRNKAYRLSVKVTGGYTAEDTFVYLTFPHCSMEWMPKDGKFEKGTKATIKVTHHKPNAENPEVGLVTYDPEYIVIRIADAASDSAAGASAGAGSKVDLQGSPPKYSYDSETSSLVFSPPGIGLEIPMGAAMTPGGYRSAGLLANYGLVSGSFAAPPAFHYSGIEEVAALVAEYAVQSEGATSEKHYIAPRGVLRVRGWDSATQSAVSLTGALETLVEVYAAEDYAVGSHSFSNAPHSYYRLELATGDGMPTGVRLVQSNFGVVSTRMFQTSGDGLLLRETDGSRVTETLVIPPATGSSVSEKRVTVTRGGVLISSTTETYELQGTNYILVSKTVDPSAASGDELTTQTSYYSDGRVRSVSKPDGSWSYFTYDGNLTTTYSPWLSSSSLVYSDGIWSLPTSGSVVKNVSSQDTSGSSSTTYLIDLSGSGPTVQMSGGYSTTSDNSLLVRTTSTENRGGGNEIVSYSLAYSPQNTDLFLAGRTLMTWDATGRATLYQYESGNWSGPVFTPAANGTCVRTSTMTGYLASPTAWSGAENFTHVPSHSIKEVTITTELGVVREETHVCNGPGSYQLALAKDHEYEPSGQFRPTGVKINGVYMSKTEYVSPLITRQWSEDGSMTETEVNSEGEMIRSARSGNATVPAVNTTYQHYGLTTTAAVNGQTVSVVTQDGVGRAVWSQDTTGAVVSTDYSDGGRTVTRTAPGGVTTVNARHYDGHAISTTGSGVIPRFYSYSVAAGGLVTTTTAVGSAGSPRVTSSTRFWDGSTASESSPDPAGGAPVVLTYEYAPNSSSLVRVYSSAPNSAARVQLNPAGSAESAMGDYSLSGLETDGNGPTITSTDRVSDSSSSYVLSGGTWNRQTITRAFHTDGSANCYTRTSLTALAPVAVSDSTYGSGLRWTSSTSNGTTTVTSNRDCFFGGAATVQSIDDSATSISPDSITVSNHGQTVSTSAYGTAALETMAYDASGRMIRHTSATGANTTFGYNAGQLETTTDHEGKTTTTLYYPNNHQNAGLLWKTINPKSEVTETIYSTLGQVIETTGNGTYRVTYGYNSYGERDTMRTYRTSGSAGDLTQWTYDPATGVLNDKTDAATKKTLYTYDSNGRLKTRTWARPGSVMTTYTYNAFGDLTFTDYSDSTLDVTVVPDRLGHPVTITDSSGTRTQTYHPITGDLDLVSYGSSGPLASLQMDYTWDASLRPAGYSVSGGGPASVLDYDSAGRLFTVISSGSTHTHGYLPGTGTLANLTTTSGSTTVLTRTLYHDRMQRLRGIVTANATGTPLSRHGYTLDDAGRRKTATRENGQRWDYGYDTLGQVTSAVKKFPGDAAIPGHTFAYQFDGIGNRTSAIQGGTDTGVTYTPNALNQYSPITTEGGRFILGEAPVANAVTVNSLTAARAGGLGFYWKQITDNNASPLWSNDTVVSNGVTIAGKTWTPAASVTPVYDFDGNLTSDGRWNYGWDAENRLTSMETTTTAAAAGVPRQLLEFVYDSQGRRISKTVSTSTDGTNWAFASNQRFLYDGWNLIAEYGATSATSTTLTLQASHTWGIDLSGTTQGAGGVGGLLSSSIINPQSQIGNCYPAYDGNGNISAWIDGTGTVMGRMDYSPFGQLVAQYKFTPTGDSTLSRLAFGFSTKYTDAESGMIYYVLRYYDPVNGRWPCKDPIEEEGGVNLYGFVGNDGADAIDAFGMIIYPPRAVGYSFKIGDNHFGGRAFFDSSINIPKCEFNITIPLHFTAHLPPNTPTDIVRNSRTMLARIRELLKKGDLQKQFIAGAQNTWDNKFKLCCKCDDCKDGLTVRVAIKSDDKNAYPVYVYDHSMYRSTEDAWNINEGIGNVAAHEIGHFLGNIDEYGKVNGVRWNNGNGEYKGAKGENYGGPSKPDGDIMNNSHGDALPIHMWYVAESANSAKSTTPVSQCRAVKVGESCDK